MCKSYRSRPLTERRSCTHGTLCTESGDNGLHHSQYDWTRGTPPVTDQHTRYTTCYRPTRVVHHLLQTSTRGTPSVTDQHAWYTTCYRPTHVITCYRPTHAVHHLLQTNTRGTPPVTDQHAWYTTCYRPAHVVHHLLQTNTRGTPPVTDQHVLYTTCYRPTHVVHHLSFPFIPACPGQYIHRSFRRWMSTFGTFQSGIPIRIFTFGANSLNL